MRGAGAPAWTGCRRCRGHGKRFRDAVKAQELSATWVELPRLLRQAQQSGRGSAGITPLPREPAVTLDLMTTLPLRLTWYMAANCGAMLPVVVAMGWAIVAMGCIGAAVAVAHCAVATGCAVTAMTWGAVVQIWAVGCVCWGSNVAAWTRKGCMVA